MNKGVKVLLPLLLCVTLGACGRTNPSISLPPSIISSGTASILPSSNVVLSTPPLSVSSPIPPSSTSQLPTTSVITSTSSVEDDFVTPLGRFSIFSKASAGEYTYIIGYPISYGEFEYTGKCNVYVQDGSYSYQVTNVPASDFQIGKGYMFYGRKQISPVYGARISYDGDSSTYEVKKDEGYGLADPIIPNSLSSLGSDQTYPALLNINGSELTNKEKLNLGGSFDINSITVNFSGNEVVVEVRKALLEGLQLIQYLNNLPLKSIINFGNIFFFSDGLACINRMEDIILEDQFVVDSAYEQLEIPEEVTSDLQLQKTLSGASVSWASSDESVVTNSGLVKRPEFGAEDALVTLTATITRGEFSRIKTFVVLVIAQSTPTVEGQVPFISVYQEGSGSNKLIGIYNPSSQAIDLGDFSLAQYANGSTVANGNYSYSLTGRVLPAKTTLYIYNVNGSLYAEVFSQYEQSIGLKGNVVDFNGNDALALLKNGTVIDVVGFIGQSVTDGWGELGGVHTKDQTLIRSSTVSGGNKEFTVSEWRFTGKDNLDFLK